MLLGGSQLCHHQICVLAFFQGGFNTLMVATCPAGHTSRLSRTEAIAVLRLGRIYAQRLSETSLALPLLTTNVDGGNSDLYLEVFAIYGT